jgi:hypothetical protein
MTMDAEWKRDVEANGFYWFTEPRADGVALAYVERDAATLALKLTVIATDGNRSLGTTSLYVTRHADVRFLGPLEPPPHPGDTK